MSNIDLVLLGLIKQKSQSAYDIKKGIEPMEAIEKASSTYGRFDGTVKKIEDVYFVYDSSVSAIYEPSKHLKKCSKFKDFTS